MDDTLKILDALNALDTASEHIEGALTGEARQQVQQKLAQVAAYLLEEAPEESGAVVAPPFERIRRRSLSRRSR